MALKHTMTNSHGIYIFFLSFFFNFFLNEKNNTHRDKHRQTQTKNSECLLKERKAEDNEIAYTLKEKNDRIAKNKEITEKLLPDLLQSIGNWKDFTNKTQQTLKECQKECLNIQKNIEKLNVKFNEICDKNKQLQTQKQQIIKENKDTINALLKEQQLHTLTFCLVFCFFCSFYFVCLM